MSQTTNYTRAARLIPVFTAHAAAQNEPGLEDKSEAVQNLLNDLMHYCELEGIDFENSLFLADLTYQNEREGADPLALPDPLVTPRG